MYFGCHLDEVRVGVCGELLHHRFGNVDGGVCAFEPQRCFL
jgi:hypothetical protein